MSKKRSKPRHERGLEKARRARAKVWAKMRELGYPKGVS